MEPEDLEKTLDVLKTISDLELSIAELYLACSELREGEKDFWLSLEQDEQKHAQKIQGLVQIVSEKPSCFVPNHSFNLAALNTLKNFVGKNIKRLRNHQIPLDFKNLLSIAWNIEYSISEVKYNEIFLISEQEYETLLAAIITETAAHRSKIGLKIAAMRNWTSKSASRIPSKGPNGSPKRFSPKGSAQEPSRLRSISPVRPFPLKNNPRSR